MANVPNSPFQPGVVQDAFVPDQLIAGDLKIVTATRTIAAGQNLRRGTALGKITASDKYVLALAASADGSQTPVEILVDDVDATAGDTAGGTYLMGEFNQNAIILGAGITLAAARAAFETKNIYLKSPVSSALPT